MEQEQIMKKEGDIMVKRFSKLFIKGLVISIFFFISISLLYGQEDPCNSSMLKDLEGEREEMVIKVIRTWLDRSKEKVNDNIYELVRLEILLLPCSHLLDIKDSYLSGADNIDINILPIHVLIAYL